MGKAIVIRILGDASSYERELRKADSASDGFGKRLGGMGKAAALAGGAAGLALLTKGLSSSVEAAKEAEKAEFRLGQAFDSAGVSAKERAKAQEAISRVSKQAALDDEDLSDVLAKLTRSTGDVTKAQEAMALAAEISRARNISLEAASKAVEKAYLSNATALKKVGVEVPKVSEAYEGVKARIKELREQLKEAEGPAKKQIELAIEQQKAQLDNAKALDKAATAQNAIAKAQEQFAGASEKYGKTAAGAQERFQVAVENLQESIGKKLLPVLAKLAEVATEVISWLEKNGPAIGEGIKKGVDVAMKVLGPFIATVKDIASIVGNVVKGVVAIFQGDWGKAWDEFGEIPGKAFEVLKRALLTIPTLIGEAALGLGKKLVEKIGEGLAALPGKLLDLLALAAQGLAQLPAVLASAALEVGRKILGAIGDGLTGTISGLGGIGEKIAGALSGIGGAGTVVFSAAKEVGGRVLGAIGSGLEGAISGVGSIGAKLADLLGGIGEAGSAVFNAARSAGGRIMGAIRDGLEQAAGFGNAIFGRVRDGIENVLGDLVGQGRRIADKLKDGIAAAAGFGSAVFGRLVDGLANVKDNIIGLGRNIAGWIKSGISSVGDLLSGAFAGAVNRAIDILNAAIGAYNAIPLAPNIPKIPKIGGGSSPTSPEDARRIDRSEAPRSRDLSFSAPEPPAPLAVSTPSLPTPVYSETLGGMEVYRAPGSNIKMMAAGGIVRARPGGTLARIGEAGQDEAVIPLPRGGLRAQPVELHFHMGTVVSDRELADVVWEALRRYEKHLGGSLRFR